MKYYSCREGKTTVVENAGVTDECYCRSEHSIWEALELFIVQV